MNAVFFWEVGSMPKACDLKKGNVVALEIPASLVFEIEQTAPGIKGASATARTKPATLSNGVEIQVPEYLESGEMVRVNTETRKFMSRA
jgi:elongation factor P